MLDAYRVITDDGEKCYARSIIFFSSHSRVDSSENINNTLPFLTYSTPHRINDISTTPEEIIKILSGRNISKASGSDGIIVGPNRVLRECATEPPKLFILSLLSPCTCFHYLGKITKVVLIYKMNDRRQIRNYKPVSLLSNMSWRELYTMHYILIVLYKNVGRQFWQMAARLISF